MRRHRSKSRSYLPPRVHRDFLIPETPALDTGQTQGNSPKASVEMLATGLSVRLRCRPGSGVGRHARRHKPNRACRIGQPA